VALDLPDPRIDGQPLAKADSSECSDWAIIRGAANGEVLVLWRPRSLHIERVDSDASIVATYHPTHSIGNAGDEKVGKVRSNSEAMYWNLIRDLMCK
jgi:hypothetical protein